MKRVVYLAQKHHLYFENVSQVNTSQILLEQLQRFDWNVVSDELQRRAPVLHKMLKVCVDVMRKKRPAMARVSNDATMGVCVAILLHHKNQHINALQHLISLILHHGHAGKQVKTPHCNGILAVIFRWIL